MGAEVKIDAERQLLAIRFRGDVANDLTVKLMAELRNLVDVDTRGCLFTRSVTRLLRLLLPHARMIH